MPTVQSLKKIKDAKRGRLPTFKSKQRQTTDLQPVILPILIARESDQLCSRCVFCELIAGISAGNKRWHQRRGQPQPFPLDLNQQPFDLAAFAISASVE
jgi:hypothetical protein